MNIKRIRLTRFEREDNFDFNMIRGVNQLLFTSITDQQCRMSFNRPWTISIYCRITLINVAGFSLIFTTVLHPSPPHHPIHHCFAPLPTPSPYSPLFYTPPHPTILFTTVLHPSPPHHPIHHCFAPIPPPSCSPLFCTPPHPTTLFATVLHPSNTPTILFRQISVPRVNSVWTGQVLCAESAQKILTRTNLERPHVKTVSMGPRLCNWLRLLQRHVAVRD